MNLQSSQLGSFGWNQFSPAHAQVTTEINSDISITNAASLLALLPQQASGTALASQDYDLSVSDLIPQTAGAAIEFELLADGTYKLKGNGSITLTKIGNQFRLQLKNGTIMMFRADGQLDYVQDVNGNRISAVYDAKIFLKQDSDLLNSIT
jgi:hypothetical protein